MVHLSSVNSRFSLSHASPNIGMIISKLYSSITLISISIEVACEMLIFSRLPGLLSFPFQTHG